MGNPTGNPNIAVPIACSDGRYHAIAPRGDMKFGTENKNLNSLSINQIGSLAFSAPTISLGAVSANTQTINTTGGVSGVTSWTMQYKNSTDSTWLTFSNPTVGTPSITLSGLSPATSYDYRIAASNGVTTLYSNIVTQTTSSVGSWQLASGHYVPRPSGRNMYIEHPRPDSETNSYAQHRWWLPGVEFSTRICVRDGSYPFFFELDAVSQSKGMTIGAQLSAVGDHLEPDALYAKLRWLSPTAGTHEITVYVYDQEFERGVNPSVVASVTWSLVISNDASRYVAIDPVNGNDTTGNGTLALPFRTLERIHNDSSATTTFANRQVILRAGTTQVNGMSGNANNIALFQGAMPCVFVGYPGETCTLELYQGWFAGRGAGDVMFKNITIRHASEFAESMHFWITVTGVNRLSFHDCDLTNYYAGYNTGSNNPALIYTTTGGTTSHLTIEGCDLYGRLGAVLTSYMLDGGTFQHNRIHDANTTGELDPSNQWNMLYLKDSTRNFTVRANAVWENNSIGCYGFVGCGGQNDGGFPYSADGIVIEYNTIGNMAEHGIENSFEYSAALGSVYINRNSCAQDIHHGSISRVPNPYVATNNAAVGGLTNMPAGLTQSGNISGAGLFDSQMKLTGTNRTNYLGTHGAEIA